MFIALRSWGWNSGIFPACSQVQGCRACWGRQWYSGQPNTSKFKWKHLPAQDTLTMQLFDIINSYKDRKGHYHPLIFNTQNRTSQVEVANGWMLLDQWRCQKQVKAFLPLKVLFLPPSCHLSNKYTLAEIGRPNLLWTIYLCQTCSIQNASPIVI